ncbi:hypothetical protein EDB92DRAFT_1815281 [Lactarius akahatsu]|uniref:Uncharacterized protein n=1 Tax=Lactarius akahatsu TaxID=416441 RepID=A0AAD4LI36_9AGAM|nr:hypothetical protein EDB92DRAFT_1815281 [Lactarius akahatsu]
MFQARTLRGALLVSLTHGDSTLALNGVFATEADGLGGASYKLTGTKTNETVSARSATRFPRRGTALARGNRITICQRPRKHCGGVPLLRLANLKSASDSEEPVTRPSGRDDDPHHADVPALAIVPRSEYVPVGPEFARDCGIGGYCTHRRG